VRRGGRRWWWWQCRDFFEGFVASVRMSGISARSPGRCGSSLACAARRVRALRHINCVVAGESRCALPRGVVSGRVYGFSCSAGVMVVTRVVIHGPGGFLWSRSEVCDPLTGTCYSTSLRNFCTCPAGGRRLASCEPSVVVGCDSSRSVGCAEEAETWRGRGVDQAGSGC